MTEVIELLKEQKKLELEHVNTIGETLNNIENPMVKVVLEIIIHDSRKHAAVAQALIDVEAGEVPTKLDMDLGPATTLNQSIKQHVKVEMDMIEMLGGIGKLVKDDRVQRFIDYLVEEEKRHHKLLKEFSLLLDRDSVSMDEYLDLFLKYMVVPLE